MKRLEQAWRLGHASENAYARPLGRPLGRRQEQDVRCLDLPGNLFLQPDLTHIREHLAEDALGQLIETRSHEHSLSVWLDLSSLDRAGNAQGVVQSS